jgi:hypothetical protein
MSKLAPRVQFNFMEEEVADDPVVEHVMDEDDIDDEMDQDPLGMPEPVEREVIEQENIFDVPVQNQLVKELLEKELPKPKKVPIKKEPKLTKSGKPRKPMSEEAKAKLALGRKKALETRRAKMIQRQEQKAIDDEEKELRKKKKEMDFKKLKKEVEEPESVKPAPAPAPQVQMFSRKDLEDAQLSAIMSYEKIRAERKKQRAEEQLIEQQRQEIRNKLTKAPGTYQSHYNQNNRFYNCY